MQLILLSGGSGKRLWPLSNNARSKQFLPLLEKEDGTMESMVQRVVRQVREANLTKEITLATNASQLDIITNQLGDTVSVVTEPERRDTFPAIARDIFFIGVWTAQRVSDYNYLHRENIGRETISTCDACGNIISRQVLTVSLTQHKTGKRITIPCSSELQRILEKYPRELPHIYDQKLGKLMKEIGRMAGLDEVVEMNITKGGIPSKMRARKWELIQTHTARRTGATLMYLSGMDVYDICKITGHSSVSILENYLKASELETVRKISQRYDYFR